MKRKLKNVMKVQSYILLFLDFLNMFSNCIDIQNIVFKSPHDFLLK